MLRLLVASLAVLATSVVSQNEGYVPIPAFLWSPAENVFPGSNLYEGLERSGVSQESVLEKVTALEKDSELNLKAVLLFIAEELRESDISNAANAFGDDSNGGQLPHLYNSVQTSSSSMVYPSTFVTMRGGVQKPWSRWLFNHKENIVASCPKKLKESLTAASNNSDEPVAVVFSLKGKLSKKWDEQMKAAEEAVSELTNGRYVSVFTGNKHHSVGGVVRKVQIPGGLEVRELAATEFTAGKLAFSGVIATSVSPQIAVALLFSLVLLLTTFTFFFCMDTLQAPTKFAKELPPLGKVYE